MRARHYTECAVALIAIIQMQTDNKDRFQHEGRRLNKGVALLPRPPRIRGAFNPFSHWDAQILVQGDKPITLDSLRE